METIKLSDLHLLFIDGDRGINYPKRSDFINDGYCLFLDASNINDYGFAFDKVRFISKEKSDSMGSGKLQKYDIVISTRGTLGKVAIYDDSVPYDNIRINSSMLIIRPESYDESINLFCQLKSPFVQQQIELMCSGSVQKQLTQEHIKNLNIVKNFDKNSLKLLTDLYSGIKINACFIYELEFLAKTIYDYWFLQFDFPNEEGKPYKSSGGAMVWNEELKMEIPKGWSVTKLGNLADIVTGKEDANHAVPDGKYPFFTCSNSISKCNDFKFDSKAILIAGNGDFNIKYYDGKFNAYQRTYVVTPKDDMMTGLLYFCVLKNTIRFTNASVGSIEKFITKGDVENIPIIVPNNKIGFELFNNCLNLIQNYKKENDELIELRDFLLPLLMNGQVGFKDK